MRYIKFLFASFAMLMSVGCASLDCKPTKGVVLPGTDTAIVGIYIDKKGYPQATVDTVTVKPGQKITFVGPDKFEILFKNQISPISKLETGTSNGILVIEIPKEIFERQQSAKNTVEIRELIYKYGIRANGKVTDPTIRVERY